MADEDKTRPRDWGHHKSPFFQLAPEIRNKIYHETFEGSQRDLVHDPPLTTNVVPVTGRRSVFTTVKSNHQFLLTCFQVYCEALAIYWSLTVIRNGGCRQNPDGHFSRGYFLNRIPAIARQHIQHLRGVKLGPNDWSACRWSQGQAVGLHLSTAPSIGLFPNLKTCSVVVCLCLIHALDRVELEGLQKELDARKSKVRLLVKHIHDLGTHCYLSLSPPFGDLHGYCPFPIQKVSSYKTKIPSHSG